MVELNVNQRWETESHAKVDPRNDEQNEANANDELYHEK